MEIGLFFLEKRKLIFFKIFNVFKPYFSKKLGEFDLFLSNFSKKPSPFTDFCLNSFFSLLLAVAYFSEESRTLITFQIFFQKFPKFKPIFFLYPSPSILNLFFQTFSRYSNDMTPISKIWLIFVRKMWSILCQNCFLLKYLNSSAIPVFCGPFPKENGPIFC